jgi:hypothetical protein
VDRAISPSPISKVGEPAAFGGSNRGFARAEAERENQVLTIFEIRSTENSGSSWESSPGARTLPKGEARMPHWSILHRSRITALVALAMLVTLVGAVPAAAVVDTSFSCPDGIEDAGFTDIGSHAATTRRAIDCLAVHDITHGTSPAGRWRSSSSARRPPTG